MLHSNDKWINEKELTHIKTPLIFTRRSLSPEMFIICISQQPNRNIYAVIHRGTNIVEPKKYQHFQESLKETQTMLERTERTQVSSFDNNSI